jgi:hypothetical protein
MSHARAATQAPRALAIAVILASLVTALVPPGRRPELISTSVTLAGACAVAVAAVAATAEEEDLAASAADDEPE